MSRVTSGVPAVRRRSPWKLVPLAGFEPAHLSASDFKSGVSTNSTTEAKMVPPAGLEPARLSTTASKAAVSAVPPQGLNGPPGRTRTCDLSVRSRTLSIQLSYGGGNDRGDPGWTQTGDLPLRRRLLFSTELQGRKCGALGGTRTRTGRHRRPLPDPLGVERVFGGKGGIRTRVPR